jgi:hypothetical protein
MKTSKHSIFEQLQQFTKNKKAVIGLPMKLTVSLIIGTIALVTILSYIMNPCMFPSQMIVSVNPILNTIPGDQPSELNITVFVNDTNGHTIKDAIVMIKGLGGIGSNYTDENGKTIINITVELAQNANEGYLDISVKAACHEKYIQDDLIKIVKQ